MRLTTRRLQIVAVTGEGRFGVDLELGEGLTVLRAGNSMGKSTIANSLLYAFGGEGMLGPDWPLPLKYCLYDYLVDDDNAKHDVLESWVTAELANGVGAELSVRRYIKSEQYSRNLTQLWDGRVLSDPGKAHRRADAFLHRSGSAQRPAGFHTRLAEFIGWQLTTVTRYDGSRQPLYIELLLPFLFIEQQRGWTGVRANVPRYFGVRDPGRRGVDFLLALDADERAQRRERLLAEEVTLRRQWSARVSELRGALASDALRLQHIPENPPLDWPPSPPPAIEALDGEEWVNSGAALTTLRTQLKELREREVPTVQAAAADVERTLGELEQRYGQLSAAHTEAAREVEHDRGNLRRIDQRLDSLKVDRQRHLDAQHVVKLGGTPAATLTEGRCPTCDQRWPADLLGGEEQQEPAMSIEEHLDMIEQERRSLAALRKGAAAVLDERCAREGAMREQLAEMRADIRAHRETLLADAKRPSVAAVREQLLAEDRVRRLEEARLGLTVADDDLGKLSETFRENRAALKTLETDESSERDRSVLASFRSAFLEQLQEYGFRSLDGVTLSEQTYLPERQGFDLTHEVSASDTIRLIWGYLLGMLETGAEEPSNHPGILVLDEPGQQEVEPASLRAFLARAAGAARREQQVLVTVTRPIEELRSATLDSQAHVIDFGDHTLVLQPLE